MRTRRISIRQAAPGMVAADDVYNSSNQMVISRGTLLTDKIITRLKFYCISDLNIVIPDKNKPQPTVNQASSQSQRLRETVEFKQFSNTFNESVQDFKGELTKISSEDTEINVNGLLEQTSKILSNSRNGIHVFDMLHCMREYDDITYVHSVNVSLLCNVFGQWLKLPEKDIEVLTLSGLLHDIGKLTLPSHIINKQERLTPSEYAIIKTHTLQGFNALNNKNIDPRVKQVTLMHHERCDGSGYPNGLKGNEIDTFARIVGIVDVYDAMTSARVYRPALSPFDAIRLFETEGLQKYDPQFIMIFLNEIVQAYVGNRVRLNNKLEGEIRMINKHALSRPVIQLSTGFLDLSREKDIYIEAVL
ncbi:HD family phosphohydrolase [Anaerocolumna cellulosilytica]|uniref:HD family phosphohydrolase n=1 Tax=Anaerocolumna cellulosilytica TaxID=433286 RepID=A0A6S6R1R6_9FIRM|nr:HD-GYP domain-containing protein [Anaerocolumna cellulosilytica]MBB5195844.1 putative nucleotidyltransferase with HDIG domain [Anaerocolumna cellulosilytica]BCJ96854.1 HD family phosphohydrolase [Anaerocolumna cellulosilytica]